MFQLDSIDTVEITPTADSAEEDSTYILPEVIFDATDLLDSDNSSPSIDPPGFTEEAPPNPLLTALPGTIGRSAFYGTLKPSSSALSSLSSISTINSISGLSAYSASQASQASECGTFRANGMGSFRSTLTMRTLGTIGSKRGTLTLARIKGTLRRPALSEVFKRLDENKEKGSLGAASLDGAELGTGEHEEDAVEVEMMTGGGLEVPAVPNVPANTPIKAPRTAISRPTLPTADSRTGTLKGKYTSVREGRVPKDSVSGSVRGTNLLKALLPLAAHLVPLPDAENDELLEEEEMDGGYFGRGVFGNGDVQVHVDGEDEMDEDAERALIDGLEMGGLELIVSQSHQ